MQPLSLRSLILSALTSSIYLSPIFQLANAQETLTEVDVTFSQADIAAASANVLSRPRGGGRPQQRYSCKCYPGDRCYPAPAVWSAFNQTVGGNLQVALPPGAPCYNTLTEGSESIPTFDAAKCADVQANFFAQQWKYVRHSIIISLMILAGLGSCIIC